MKLITRDTDYAIRALIFIASHKNKRISASDLVRELRIPRPFLRKILQILHKEGVLISYKGQGGGFLLATSPDKIFLTDLIEIFQGPLKINECIFKRKICPNRNACSLRRKISSIEKQVLSGLRVITLASLLN
jgi:Rrf2 family protein